MRLLRTPLFSLALVLVVLGAACGDDAATTTTAAPATTAAPTTTAAPATTAAPEPEAPSVMRVAFIAPGPIDDPWYQSMLHSLERLAEKAPYGLEISTEWFENIEYGDSERIFRDLAASGNYEMILGSSTYSDAVSAVMGDHPDVLFIYAGSGNDPLGGNAFWIDTFIHEPAYLTGVAAGMMTETDKIGVVANFPFPNVNAPINGYLAGARSVNPDVDFEVTFIESWWDPATAKEAAAAQIAAGADVLYAIVFGVFEAAEEAGVYGVGDLIDVQFLAPDVVLTSTVAKWDQAIEVTIDAWWDQMANGVPMNAPMERIMFHMPQGGGDIAPLNEALVPADVHDKVLEARDQILSGDLVVDLNDAPPE